MKQMLVNLEKGTRKKLVKEFHQRTGNELQDEWYESEDYKDWMRSLHPDYDEVVSRREQISKVNR